MARRKPMPRASEPLPLLDSYPRRRWFAVVALEAAVVLLAVAFALVVVALVSGHG